MSIRMIDRGSRPWGAADSYIDRPISRISSPNFSHNIQSHRQRPSNIYNMADISSVLIVEDDDDLQQLLQFNFESNGFDVVARDDGAEALAYLDETEILPDVIILDLLMPDVDGLDFLRKRADSERLASIPTVILSGVDDEDTLAEAYELGVDDYVTKPFSPNALITRVTHLE
jgi:CheY-like chemotaxis protein